MSAAKRCPHPKKVAHPSQTAAQAHLTGLRARFKSVAAKQRVYKCGDHWHVGGLSKRNRRRW